LVLVIVWVMVIVRMVVIMRVAVGMIMAMRMIVLRRCDVRAAFRIERGLDGDDLGAEAREQRLDRWIAAEAQPIGEELHRHVTIAEMPGKPRQRGEIMRARLDQRFRLGDHFDQGAVVEHEQVAHAQGDGLVEIELAARSLDSGHRTARGATALEIEDDRIDDMTVARPGGSHFGNATHGRARGPNAARGPRCPDQHQRATDGKGVHALADSLAGQPMPNMGC
jgi:hypothetical protein